MEGHDWVGITAANGRQWVCKECEAERWESRDARDEAERVVDDFAGVSMLLWDGDDVMPEATAKRDRLVAVLVAAIEAAEQHTSCPNADAGEPERCAECRLIAAVIPLLRAPGRGGDGMNTEGTA